MSELKDDYDFLSDSRKRLRTKCTRTCNAIDSNLSNYDLTDVRNSIANIREIRSKLDKLNEEISRLLWKLKDEDSLNKEYERIDEYDQKMVLSLNKLEKERAAQTHLAEQGEPGGSTCSTHTLPVGTNPSSHVPTTQTTVMDEGMGV